MGARKSTSNKVSTGVSIIVSEKNKCHALMDLFRLPTGHLLKAYTSIGGSELGQMIYCNMPV